MERTDPQSSEAAGLWARRLSGILPGPFDLEVEPGACAAITGASGAGKSLLLRMICDLDPNTGDAGFGTLHRATLSGPQWRRRVVYVAADSGWWDARVEAAFAPEEQADARALMEALALAPALFSATPERLFSGERQRFALIRALVRRPLALLLDEPTGALDPDSVARVGTLLTARLQAGMALVLVTHDHALAGRMASRRYEMRSSRLEPL